MATSFLDHIVKSFLKLKYRIDIIFLSHIIHYTYKQIFLSYSLCHHLFFGAPLCVFAYKATNCFSVFYFTKSLQISCSNHMKPTFFIFVTFYLNPVDIFCSLRSIYCVTIKIYFWNRIMLFIFTQIFSFLHVQRNY